MNTTHDQQRRALWCNVYVALAGHPTASVSRAEEWADGALKRYDARFPKHDGSGAIQLTKTQLMAALDYNLEIAGIKMTVARYNKILIDCGFALEDVTPDADNTTDQHQ